MTLYCFGNSRTSFLKEFLRGHAQSVSKSLTCAIQWHTVDHRYMLLYIASEMVIHLAWRSYFWGHAQSVSKVTHLCHSMTHSRSSGGMKCWLHSCYYGQLQSPNNKVHFSTPETWMQSLWFSLTSYEKSTSTHTAVLPSSATWRKFPSSLLNFIHGWQELL